MNISYKMSDFSSSDESEDTHIGGCDIKGWEELSEEGTGVEGGSLGESACALARE